MKNFKDRLNNRADLEKLEQDLEVIERLVDEGAVGEKVKKLARQARRGSRLPYRMTARMPVRRLNDASLLAQSSYLIHKKDTGAPLRIYWTKHWHLKKLCNAGKLKFALLKCNWQIPPGDPEICTSCITFSCGPKSS